MQRKLNGNSAVFHHILIVHHNCLAPALFLKKMSVCVSVFSVFMHTRRGNQTHYKAHTHLKDG